jgi:glycerol-3-phosphate cytidylyltransferase-like family protein
MKHSEVWSVADHTTNEGGELVIYCASPRIRPNFGVFDEELLAKYRSVYVKDLQEIMDKSPQVEGYFVPSTIFLDSDSPFKDGNLEYCLAKSEQEQLVISRMKGLSHFMPRIGIFPGRHSQMSFSADQRTLPEVMKDYKRWLQSFT